MVAPLGEEHSEETEALALFEVEAADDDETLVVVIAAEEEEEI